MSTNITPAPWTANGTAIVDRNGNLIAEARRWGAGMVSDDCPAPWGRALGNAQLIAAAPELLAALRDTVATLMALSEKYQDGLGNLVGTSVYNARQVMAKAEGQPQGPSTSTKFLLLSPDGLEVLPVPFDTVAEARAYLAQFVARYAEQGYYASALGERIPLGEIADRCQIEAIEWDETEAEEGEK